MPTPTKKALYTTMVAFAADPLTRWVLPQADMYLIHGIRIFDPFGPVALPLVPPTRYQALSPALWVPPRQKDRDEAAPGALGQSAQMIVAPERLDGVSRVVDEMHSYHLLEPCWCLPFVGVDPRHQGQGCSAKLMKCALAQCNAQGLPAYLEFSNPADITLYQRHGFELTGVFKVPVRRQ